MKVENKKIYRSETECMIAGVCGGLGEYFQIDATLVRIIFILLAIGGGTGVFIYILLALIIPKKNQKENTNNIEDLSETIKEKTSKISHEIKQNKNFNIFGLILIALGGMFLWNKFGFFRIDSDILWPIILIIFGFSILFK